MSLVSHQSNERSPRRDVKIPVTLRRGSIAVNILMQDLSETGFRAMVHGDAVREGDGVTVSAPFMGSQKVRVVWRVGNAAGFEFAKPLSSALVSSARNIDTVRVVNFKPPSVVRTEIRSGSTVLALSRGGRRFSAWHVWISASGAAAFASTVTAIASHFG
jgi:hypothetical protein